VKPTHPPDCGRNQPNFLLIESASAARLEGCAGDFDLVIPLTGARASCAEHAAKLEGICP
jgi:hypothetical protein